MNLCSCFSHNAVFGFFQEGDHGGSAGTGAGEVYTGLDFWQHGASGELSFFDVFLCLGDGKVIQTIDQQAEIDSYLEETKLENIIRRASIDPDIAARIAPDIGGGIQDFTEAPQNLAELQNIMIRAEQIWAEVPKDIKLKFDNDVDKFIASFGSVEWAKNLGIYQEKQEKQVEAKTTEATKATEAKE